MDSHDATRNEISEYTSTRGGGCDILYFGVVTVIQRLQSKLNSVGFCSGRFWGLGCPVGLSNFARSGGFGQTLIFHPYSIVVLSLNGVSS